MMCSAGKFGPIFLISPGFLAKLWCVLQEKLWIKTITENPPKKCSSNLFNLLTSCLTLVSWQLKNRWFVEHLHRLLPPVSIFLRQRKKHLNTIPYFTYSIGDILLPYIGIQRPYTEIYGIVFRCFSDIVMLLWTSRTDNYVIIELN